MKQETQGVITDRHLIDIGMRLPCVSVLYRHRVKSPKEKMALKKARLAHNAMLISAGYSPKKRLNLSEPMTIGGHKSR